MEKKTMGIILVALLVCASFGFAPDAVLSAGAQDNSQREDCSKLYWFDSESSTCGAKEFCGNYAYRGLETFSNQEACLERFEEVFGETQSTSHSVQSIAITNSNGVVSYSLSACDAAKYTSIEECEQVNKPVCATIRSYSEDKIIKEFRKTFANKCEACVYSENTRTVENIIEGTCEQETDIECPLIAKPAPGYCLTGALTARYNKINGKNCIVDYDCTLKKIPSIEEEIPVFMYTETNNSIGREKTFNLYKNGAMKETVINRTNGEHTILKGEISHEQVVDFLTELEELGFFQLEFIANNCKEIKICTTPTGEPCETIEDSVQCPIGTSYHKIYARWNKENKISWYSGQEEHEAIDYALERIKKYEGIMEENTAHKEKYVGLGTTFSLELGEKAKVRETGFKLKLERIEEDVAVFYVAPGHIVRNQAIQIETVSGTAVKRSGSGGVPVSNSVTANETTISTDQWIKIKVGERNSAFGHIVYLDSILTPRCAVEENNTTRCIGAKPMASVKIEKQNTPGTDLTAFLGRKFEIMPRQSATIHTANKERIMNFGLEAIHQSVDCQIQKKCKTDEETGVEICPMIHCDNRPMAKVLWNTPSNRQPEVMLMNALSIREGETVTQGKFKFHFADLVNGKAIFVVHKIEDQYDFTEVKLGEKFKLKQRQTALIVEEDVFVTLNYIENGLAYKKLPAEEPVGTPVPDIEPMACTEEAKMCPDGITSVARDPYNNCEFKPCPNEPIECTMDAKVCPDGSSVGRDPYNNCEFKPCPSEDNVYAVVSVWKKNGLEEPVPLTAEAKKRIETITRNISSVKPKIAVATNVSEQGTVKPVLIKKPVIGNRTYRLKQGESLKVHGIELSLGEIENNTAIFVAEKSKQGNRINVHLNERFKLEENMSANVLGANMHLELLGISSYTQCVDGIENAVCVEEKHVKLAVSRHFKELPVAKKIDYSETSVKIASEAIQTTTETSITNEEIIPMPFEVLDLGEGETASVGEFEISLLSIWTDRAEFIVKEKSTGTEFTFVIGKGWNIFAHPGEFRTLEHSKCNSSNFKVFGFNAKTKGFDKIREPKPGKAYWLYNPNEACEAHVELVKPVSMYELEELQQGWNFVPLLHGMLGNKLEKLGNCEVKGAFAYNTETKQWDKVLGTEITAGMLGKGIAVNVKNTCSLLSAETPGEIPELPVLPEVE